MPEQHGTAGEDGAATGHADACRALVVQQKAFANDDLGDAMDDALLEVILSRLDRVPLEPEPAGLLLAACEGHDRLEAQLSGETLQSPKGEPSQETARPVGAYLQSVTVSGFRGVGPAATLELEPGSGLTLVVGRNGSGKSSFAEGLEVLLTGELKRWQELTTVWREGWRNLHLPDEAAVSASLLLEGYGAAKVKRSWEQRAAFDNSNASVQVAGEKRTDGLDRLQWHGALTPYRPFLSHSELEAFFSGPAHLYDLLSSVLGLEDLVVTEKRLGAARKVREDAQKTIAADLQTLLVRLSSVDDERARSCHSALAGRSPDIALALSVASASAAVQPGSEVGQLRLLTQLAYPTEEDAVNAITALRDAADAVSDTAGTAAGRSVRLAHLLTAALDHYRDHGAGPCPVCGRAAALDEGWRERTTREVALLREEAAEAESANEAAAAAASAARELFQPVPAVLKIEAIGSADPRDADLAWSAWVRRPDGSDADTLRRLADHIEQAWPRLAQAGSALRSAADAELRAREGIWAPMAAAVAQWCSEAQKAQEAARPVPALKAAVAWLKGATDDVRNERLAPLGEQARAIWAKLRQESNVDLGAITLSGSGNRRQVDVKVTVDGSPGAALGVMSQGEVNALALSIFLPRATMVASPFRFLVIDDPVQAMDPAKVEGLAQVLQEVSESRQVLVFTHDDRLAEAVRRLGISARILEVTRRPGSVVEARPALTPIERQLKDAQDLCADESLPNNVAARVVPGLCRLALEAAFIEATRRTQLRAGKPHAEVDAAIEAADSTTKKAALAMFGDALRGADVLPRLDNWQRSAADTYRALNKGAHDEHRGSLRSLVHQTRALTDLIARKLS
jgi:recombinational DNA repair ATPase RecF